MNAAPSILPRLIKPKEASLYIAISERTLWGLTKAGTIAAVKVGRAVRYDVRDLDHFIEQSKSRGESK
ncbi:MAG: helix-turn-helix domain-containing protein [Sedimentisphaerales bacterium]|nr:helix-turn-helix domain-containing protein [Sedimentisphaerales bacterium]